MSVATTFGNNLTSPTLSLEAYATGNFFRMFGANGTVATPTATGIQQTLGNISFQGYSGTASVEAASIKAITTNTTFGPASSGAYLSLSTTPDNTTGAIERVRISDAGRVGIGTATPVSALHLSNSTSTFSIGTPNVVISGDQLARISGGGNDGTTAFVSGSQISMAATEAWSNTAHGSSIRFFTTLNTTNIPALKLIIDNDGSLVPGVTATQTIGTAALRWGQIYTSVAVSVSSDSRLKTNISNVGYGLKEVMKMRPVTYGMKATPNQGHNVGFIAQEMQKIIPEVVMAPKDAKDFYSMKYDELIPVLTKAIQEQQAEIVKLKKQNAAITAQLNQVSDLKTAMAELRSQINKTVVNKTESKSEISK